MSRSRSRVRSARRRLRFALALLALAPALLGAERPGGLGEVRDVRTWSHPDYTRVVVELTRPVDAEVKRLAANAAALRPNRLYVDLEGIWVGRKYVDGLRVGDGLLKAVRLGQNKLRTSRLVIDLERYESHRLLLLSSPDRVVVDVYGPRTRDETAFALDDDPGDGAAPSSRLAMGYRAVQTVVIDAGHGGKDPGAIGIGGLREKDVNLRLAKRLAKQLEARGFHTVLTRQDDRFLDLVERTAFAESADGDLFVSIHANASPRRKTRGIEIYHLDRDHERHSLDVAARESGVPRSKLDSLQRTLARLRVTEASHHSSKLAHYVHEDVIKGLRKSKRARGVTDLGVKKGPFYVLFLSSMPAILVEAGFLTNKDDAKLLRSSAHLDLLAERMASGLERYRDAAPTLVAGTPE